ncbi:MAG TPA: histidinol dehydrogenase [Opitutaceae bacterium]|nr:histidinol dehydrogenase [Opitutaceae bacterium]
MRRIRFSDRKFSAELAAFAGEAAPPPAISRAVARILAEVRRDGDAAVARYALRFDGARLRPADFRVPAPELAAALRGLPAARRRALAAAQAGIGAFNRRGLPRGWSGRNRAGAQVGEKFDPIRRVGLYVPGGQVPLVSTVLMTATLARIAGCPQIVACTPVGEGGKVDEGLLAALRLSGVTEVYRIGGVQAIGAMAYGTASVPAVDKIFGPGNAYVCEAKRQVFGTVGVDSLPGPSELMVIADASARADWAAADLIAQAEHGSGREKICLVALSPRVADAVLAEVEAQGRAAGRSASIRRVLDEGFLVVEAFSPAQAAAVANALAPEHLELMVRGPAARALTRAITTAGAIFVGNHTPTALGDFVAGPSHVLPTAGTGRFLSGLRVADFQRRTSLVRYGPAALRRDQPVVAAFAAMERLDAHGRSARIRLE